MTTPLYPYQMPPQTQPVLGPAGGMVNPFYYLLTALFNRTGGPSGVPFTAGQQLAASGSGQGDALLLMDDFNEVLSGTGGVILAALQPAQSQVVYNGSGSTITVYPTSNGQIDNNPANTGVTLANDTFGFFTAYEVLAGGAPLYRSWQVQGAGATATTVAIIPTVNWYVSAIGSDSNDGQSVATAFATIQHAVNVILSYWFNGQVITLNVGAGSFASFDVVGLGSGSSGGAEDVDQLGIVLVGAGSGSTTIAAGSQLRGARLNLSACTVDCTAIANAFSGDAYSTLVLASDVIFSGNSGSAVALAFNQFSSVIQDGNVTLSGTIGTYFSGFAFANYEQNTGALTIAGGTTIGTLLNLDILSNYHFFGGSVVVSGTANGAAYLVQGGSVVSELGTIDISWGAAGGQTGQLTTGGRSENCVTAPSVVSTTGLGTGSAALRSGAAGYCLPIILSPTGSPGSSGFVTVQVNEFLDSTPGTIGAFAVSLMAGSAAWDPGSTTRIINFAATTSHFQLELAWNNNGTNLTAGQTYVINLLGQT